MTSNESNSAPSCDICTDIYRYFADPKSNHRIKLGSFDEALASPCQAHTPIVKAFREHVERIIAQGAVRDTRDVGFMRTGTGSATLTQSLSKLGVCWSFLLAEKPGLMEHPGTGRILDPEWADIEIVNKWKRQCLMSHGMECDNPMKLPSIKPAWLVDVERKCVVAGQDCDRYLALSYRWGNTAGFRLDESILHELQREGSLFQPTLLASLPLMIQHAISLTAALRERYLWVDALCVVHGGHSSTAEQINLMSAIYAGAVVTIVAADGVSSDGLLGVRDVAEPRGLNQKVYPFGDEQLIVRNTDIFSLENYSDYHKRSWTYQEFKMSARKLFFHTKELHWQCQCSVWHEELTFGTEADVYIDPRPGVLLAGFPDLDSFAHMLSQYNNRDLTYDEDALSGIAGLLSVVSRTFTGGFLHGCPEMFFERALAWRPQWHFTNLRRRVISDRPASARVSASALPSWSWIGWHGMMTMQYGEAMRINDRQYSMEEIIPVTEWYTSAAPSGQPLRRIRSTWYENREQYKDLSKPLPDGWTRLEADSIGTFRDEPRLYPDGCGKYVFQHRDMPAKDSQYWYYPFPVAKIDATTPFFTPEQTPYLMCKTQKAELWSYRADPDTFVGPNAHILHLCKEMGSSSIGTLHLQTDEQLNTWPEFKPGDLPPEGRSIEVVAISRSVQYNKTFNEELKRYDHPLTRNEVYNVLWVEWKEGIAYRLASGRVDKTAWEELSLEAIDLVLG
ncbi:hypothetical protein LTS08_005335 [Lithohypha guttulata]|uniref:uncharacterized protein n=1 Tax=Lithohypha guttulata TaxID=1690604 RepID=UPI002DE044B6|nr:hypothetical protein LTR51_004969 [Lithohypha guttulata]KAK5100584.1 hypothetical protein LTS08_005335 [Lithohypha guttulata]